jgi:hypothetical protein
MSITVDIALSAYCPTLVSKVGSFHLNLLMHKSPTNPPQVHQLANLSRSEIDFLLDFAK